MSAGDETLVLGQDALIEIRTALGGVYEALGDGAEAERQRALAAQLGTPTATP